MKHRTRERLNYQSILVLRKNRKKRVKPATESLFDLLLMPDIVGL